jgi:acyl carrier protein
MNSRVVIEVRAEGGLSSDLMGPPEQVGRGDGAEVIPSPSFVTRNFSRRGQIMPTADEIDAKIAKVLAQALGVEEGEIRPSATLQGDLGAESIDFLDIVFRLEREFMFTIHQDELFPESFLVGDPAFIDGGCLTDRGLAALHAQLPYADWGALERDRRLERIDDLFTVGLLASYARWKLTGRGAAEIGAPAPAPRPSHEDRASIPYRSPEWRALTEVHAR